MKNRILLILGFLVFLGGSAYGQTPTSTPTFTATPTSTLTATVTRTPLQGVFSDFGNESMRGGVRIWSDAHDQPGLLVLYMTTAGGVKTPYYLWVDSTGDLRLAPHQPADQDTDGTVVGGQS